MLVSREGIPFDKVEEYPLADRLFRLPIEPFASKLFDNEGKPISLIAPQIAVVNALQCGLYRNVVACLSRRVGKTFLASTVATILALEPHQNIVIVAPNYTLSDISFSWILAMLKQFGIELSVSNKKDRLIELAGSLSQIRMVSSAHLDNALGRSNSLVILDEIAVDSKFTESFFALRPTADRTNSRFLFISTPRGSNWFKEYYERGFSEDYKEWVSIHATYHDNPRIIQSDIDEARKTMSNAHFRQEYLADFTTLENQVYEFDFENDVIDFEADYRGKVDIQMVIMGLDVGYRDPTASCVLYLSDSYVYVVDEYYLGEVSTATHAKNLNYYVDQHDIDVIVIDSAAAQFRADLFSEYDLPSMNAKKDVLPGIEYVKSLIENHRVKVDKNCTVFLDSILGYTWDPNPNLVKPKPLHFKSDMMDAFRYGLYTIGPGNLEPLYD